MNAFRPVGFQILPPVIKNLLIINGLMFFATYVFRNIGWIDLNHYFALYHWDSPLFKPWQFVTHIFMHADFGHLFFNMFALWMFGALVENTLGQKRFIILYFICGFGGAFLHLFVYTLENAEAINIFNQLSALDKKNVVDFIVELSYGIKPDMQPIQHFSQAQYDSAISMVIPMVGASGAVYGILFAFGYLFPNLEIFLYFLFPIKAKYFIAIYAAISIFYGFANVPRDNIAHFAHLGGMLFAFILFKVWKISSKNVRYY